MSLTVCLQKYGSMVQALQGLLLSLSNLFYLLLEHLKCYFMFIYTYMNLANLFLKVLIFRNVPIQHLIEIAYDVHVIFQKVLFFYLTKLRRKTNSCKSKYGGK